jgi:hypothetical protein
MVVSAAGQWDKIAIDGDIRAKNCLLKYKRKGRVLAVASIFRDLASLKAELSSGGQNLYFPLTEKRGLGAMLIPSVKASRCSRSGSIDSGISTQSI